MIQILSRVPGELTLFETDNSAEAITYYSDLFANPEVVIISVEFVNLPA